MSDHFAALPMYDWPERRDEVDAEWTAIRARLIDAGIDAPESLVRRNADMPAAKSGNTDPNGGAELAGPTALPPDGLDFHALWSHPKLLFGQTCWGPMELGLSGQVQLLGQPDYSTVEGGSGPFYSSAIVMRRQVGEADIPAPDDGAAILPLDRLRGRRFAFNGSDSMSGLIGLTRDLAAAGQGLEMFSDRVLSGGHRNSVVAVAKDEADVAAIDCMSWALARRFEPAAKELSVVGWTARRPGLPYIASRHLPAEMVRSMQGLFGGNAEP